MVWGFWEYKHLNLCKLMNQPANKIDSTLSEIKSFLDENEINIDEPAKSSQVKKILSDIGVTKALVLLTKQNDQLNKASKKCIALFLLSLILSNTSK